MSNIPSPLARSQVQSERHRPVPPGNLDEEIRMLRAITRRVFELADDVEELGQAVSLLGALGIASTRLANLLKAQKNLGNDQDPVMAALAEAVEKVKKDWEREKKALEGSETPQKLNSPEEPKPQGKKNELIEPTTSVEDKDGDG